MEVVRNHFKPEFINRLDDTVMFSPLGRAVDPHRGSAVALA